MDVVEDLVKEGKVGGNNGMSEKKMKKRLEFNEMEFEYGILGFGYVIKEKLIIEIVRENEGGKVMEEDVWVVKGMEEEN